VHAAPVGIGFDRLALLLGAVVFGAHRLMLRACAYYGWDDATWNAAVQPLLREWRSWLP
jgi:hypothetical protein